LYWRATNIDDTYVPFSLASTIFEIDVYDLGKKIDS
jgi:hypothetical protein